MSRRRLLDDSYKKTVEGNPAIATDSLARRYPGIGMEGWTEQQSTTGAQLINQDETVIGGLSGNTGNEFDSTNRIRTGFIRVEPNTTYIISGLSGFNIANSFAYDSEKTMARVGVVTTTTTTTTTLENESYLRISFSKPDQSDFTEEELQKLRKTLMFNKGPEALPYEPYTGGQPSPSPDYPQEIVSAGNWNEEAQKWEYEIGVGGANLFDVSKVVNSFQESPGVINNGDGTLTVNAVDSSGVSAGTPKTLKDYCPDIKVGETYVLNAETTGTLKFIYLNDGSGSWTFGTSKTITESMLNATVYFCASGPNSSAIVSKIMFNAGSTALPYEPYKPPQTVTLTADRPLTKWDKLEKRNGQWGWVYGSAEIVFDGSEDETWSYIEDGTASRAFTIYDTGGDALCNKYVYDYAMNPGQFDLRGGASEQYIRFNCYGIASDVGSWRTWLSENPLTVLYQTTEETFVPLSQTEQEQMNALHTFRPTTVLSNDADCEMELTYKTKKSLEVTA